MSTTTLAQYQAQANPSDWALATQYANKYGIPSNIFLALVAQESSWRPDAQSPNSTSYGYTQLTAGTAADLGVNAHDSAQNLQGGAEYLAKMYAKFGNWSDALVHYNQGPNQTDPAKLAQGAHYAQSVMSLAATDSSTSQQPDSGSPGLLDSVLAWIKSQLGNFFFLLIGGALIVIALLHNDTVRETASTAAKAAVV